MTRRFPTSRALADVAAGALLPLDEAVAKHVGVLRLVAGTTIELFDREGLAWQCELVLDGTTWAARTSERLERDAEPRVTLVVGWPRGPKVDDIVRGATEAGATAIHFAMMARSVSRPDELRASKKLDRLERIAEEAARQSERVAPPRVHAPRPLLEAVREAIDETPAALRVQLSPRTESTFDEQELSRSQQVILVVGPEGGLDGDEELALDRLGFVRARLRVPVLRVETAAVVVVAWARHALGPVRR